MSTSGIVIVGQIFLVLVVIAAVLLYYLNSLNNDLQQSIDQLKDRLKDEKRHAKGLRVKIQEQATKIADLETKLSSITQNDQENNDKYQSLEAEYQALQSQVESLEKSLSKESKQLKKLRDKNKSLEELLEKSNAIVEELKQKKNGESTNEGTQDFESMYYELKNAIAYNMDGGEHVLDSLRQRLLDNGNVTESEKLGELKERYNSIGEMVGVVDQVVLFDNETVEDKAIEQENELIGDAEDLIRQAEETLKTMGGIEHQNQAIKDSDNEQVIQLSKRLNEASLQNQTLKKELNTSTQQLHAFVAKAKLFAAQKEQIKMYKATQSQMHRNYVSLSNENKLAQRQIKNLENENKILSAKNKSGSMDPELMNKLDSLKDKLQEKESEMDRLKIENEMLEQQFLTISKESDLYAETESALDRLTSEHQLLEQQFLEVLGELEKQ